MNRAIFSIDITHMDDTLRSIYVSCFPSKIPYGGFSPVRLQTGFRAQPSLEKPAYMGPKPRSKQRSLHSVIGLASKRGSAPLMSALQSRGPWLPHAGYAVPRDHRLLWPHPSHSAHLAAYLLRPQGIFGMSGSLLLSATLSYRAIPCTPVDRIAAFDCYFTIRRSLHHIRSGSASTPSCIRRFNRSRNGAVSGSLALRPDRLLARLRHGLLLSSFQLRSHLHKLSSISMRSTVNCRSWTFTSKSCSLAGCKRMTRIERMNADQRNEGFQNLERIHMRSLKA